MSDQDYYELPGYPATPLSEEFVTHAWRLIDQYRHYKLTADEAAARIIDYLMKQSAITEIQREHEAMVAHLKQRRSAKPDPAEYERLKAELNRISAALRLIHNPRGLRR